MNESVRIKLPPVDMTMSDCIQQWYSVIYGTPYISPEVLPITTHIQAANEAQSMYPSADEAIITLYVDDVEEPYYEVKLYKEGIFHQTVNLWKNM